MLNVGNESAAFFKRMLFSTEFKLGSSQFNCRFIMVKEFIMIRIRYNPKIPFTKILITLIIK